LSHDESTGEVTLFVEKSLVIDCGTYAVHVGQATSQLKVDIILERPVFIEGLTDQTVVAGQPAKFTAVVRGVPRPHIRWFIGDMEVFDTADKYIASYSEDGRAELTVVAVSSSDAGLYCECRASSEAGEASSLAVLMPGWCQGKPAVPACSVRTLRIIG